MITDRLAVIHMPRTGGTALRHYLRANPRLRWVGDLGHRRLADAKGFLEVPIWGVIRNPWDWYASRYFARGLVQFPGSDIGATFDEHLRAGFSVHGFSWTEQLAHYFNEADGQCGLTKAIRFETLGYDVWRLLEELDVEPQPWASVPRMRCLTPAGEHYTDELRQLVRERDAKAIRHWGYA